MFKWFLLISLMVCLKSDAQIIPLRKYESRELKLPYISPELLKPVLSFIDDMTAEGVDVSDIERLDSIIIVPDVQCLCKTKYAIGCSDEKLVQIKRLWYFSFYQNAYYRTIIWHELGHAILRLPHYDDGGLHIMNSFIDPDMLMYDRYWPLFRTGYIRYYWYCRWSGKQFNY